MKSATLTVLKGFAAEARLLSRRMKCPKEREAAARLEQEFRERAASIESDLTQQPKSDTPPT